MISVHDAGCAGELGALAEFRQGFYGCLSARADALFELVDAVVCRPGRVVSLPGLSLEPEFRRGHGGLYDAVTAGRVEVARLRELLLDTVPVGRDGVVWFAGDVSNWPRPEARCSPERVVVHDKSARTRGGDPVTSGWPFLVLAGLEWGPTSWTAPVDAVRLGPVDTLTGQTLAGMRRVLAGLAARGRAETPGFVFDAEFDLMAFSHELAGQAHIVGRLRANQVFHADPTHAGHTPGRGRPRRHGARIQLSKPGTLGTPDRVSETVSARYGRVRLSAWDDRHRRLVRHKTSYWANHEGLLPIVTGSVVRVEIERTGPGGGAPDRPMWLWHAGPTPLDLVTIFAVYQRRFDLEHTFRYGKQELGWTVPAPMLPGTADTWTWLVLAAYTQLRLARPLSRDLRMSWEKPVEPDRIPPRRVRRDFRRLHTLLGTPANPPKTTRPGPGRPPGSTRPPRDQHPTHRKNTRHSKKTKQSATKIKPKG